MKSPASVRSAVSYCLNLLSNGSMRTSAPDPQVELDDGIESTFLQSYIYRKFLQSDYVSISSHNGDVILGGLVADEAHKAMAERTAAALAGVKEVTNRISITGERPIEGSNAWLAAKVCAALRFHRSICAVKSTVHAREGVISLTGVATSESQRNLIGEYAKDVEGVQEVRNEITIGPSLKFEAENVSDTIDDLSVRLQIQFMLATHLSTCRLGIVVDVSDGVVTLRGKAGSAAKRDRVTMLTNDINGVVAVVNKMSVEPTLFGSSEGNS